jgi:Xaa-Pro aminopeptidase
MDLLRPGIPEYAIEAAIEHAFTSAGARYPAFPTIVGSGPNSCVLHYYRNGRTIGDDEVVLIDIGAEYARYASDVTRTLPSSGRFTASQRKVHDSVLRAQAAGLAAAAPGATLESIDAAVRESLRRDGLEDHTMHGCCHWVGLDVHDVGGRDVPLRPGMVLTVEPGVYIPAEDLGVRIEDTLLVTEGGHEVLSACAPKSAAEIEERIAEARRRAARGAEVSPAAPGSPPR